MRFKIIFLISLFTISCETRSKNSNNLEKQDKVSLYDLYYIEMLSQYDSANLKLSIQSIGNLNDIDNLFKDLMQGQLLDSSTVQNLRANRKIKKAENEIIISDSIRNRILDPKGNGIKHYFSEPLMISDNRCLIFFYESYTPVGNGDGVILYSKVNNVWKLESIEPINTYR